MVGCVHSKEMVWCVAPGTYVTYTFNKLVFAQYPNTTFKHNHVQCTHTGAAGVDRNVMIWDIRSTKRHIGRWNNAHKHEITHLRLLPHAPTHVVVGGLDYEVCFGVCILVYVVYVVYVGDGVRCCVRVEEGVVCLL